MDVVKSVFDSNSACHRCQEKFGLFSKRRKCMECKFIYCSKCCLKISKNFLKRRRFCVDCIKNVDTTETSSCKSSLVETSPVPREEFKASMVVTTLKPTEPQPTGRLRSIAITSVSTFIVDNGLAATPSQKTVRS